MSDAARMMLRVFAIFCDGVASLIVYSLLRPWELEKLAFAVFMGLLAIIFSIWSVEERD